MTEKSEVSRRTFLTKAAVGAAGLTIIPRHVLGRGFTPPSDLLNIAGVGVGGMGRSNLINLASQNIVALCDVDWGYADKGFARLDTEAQNLKTRIEQGPPPAPAGQPPVEFDRVKAQTRLDGLLRLKDQHLPKAKRYQDYREMLEKQKDIDAVLFATADHMQAPIALAAAMTGNYAVPEGLDWNLFLGVGPQVEYHPIYHPFNWRGWVDWGVGAIGDMGAHLIDHTMWALNLGLPTNVETISTPFNGASYPTASLIFYEFPQRGKMPPVKVTWYDGGLMPNKPEELGDEELKKEGGALLIGSKGKLLYETYGLKPRLLPKSLHDSFGKPPQKLPRIEKEEHDMNWVEASKGKAEASCPFEYAARLTEVMLLGIVALKAGRKISYDGENMRVTNLPQANDYLRREYRQGWSV